MPKISIVIPTLNRKEILKTTLGSFAGQSFTDFEVLVADDGSTDGTGEMVKSLKLPFPIKHLWHENAGRSAARNMGIKAAEGEIILFVDDHIILDKRFIEEHLKAHDRYKKSRVGAVRGYVEFIEGPSQAPSRPRHLTLLKKIKLFFEYRDPLRFYTHNVSVKKEALLKIGGFDEDFKEYGFQDQECGYRLTRAGYKIRFNPNAIGYIFKAVFKLEKEYDKSRQAGRSAALCRRKHPWFGMRCGANPLNLFLYRIFSMNNNWWLRWNKAKKHPDRIKLFYFALGVWEGTHPDQSPKTIPT